jgi:hypothetical protein
MTRPHALEEVDTLDVVHGHGVQQHPSAAEVHQRGLDVGIPLGDLVEVGAGQGVPTHVDPADGSPTVLQLQLQLQKAAYHRWEQSAHQPSGVNRRKCRDPQHLAAGLQGGGLPGVERPGGETPPGQPRPPVGRGHHRRRSRESCSGHPIEVVAVQV